MEGINGLHYLIYSWRNTLKPFTFILTNGQDLLNAIKSDSHYLHHSLCFLLILIHAHVNIQEVFVVQNHVLPLMFYVFVDPTDIKIFLVLRQAIDLFHFEHLYQYFLGSLEKDTLVTLIEIQGFWQYAKELWLLKAHTEPFFND